MFRLSRIKFSKMLQEADLFYSYSIAAVGAVGISAYPPSRLEKQLTQIC